MRGSLWVASYVALWCAVVVLSVVVTALLRQVGVLHTRLRPIGTHFAGEGPERGQPAPPLPDVDYQVTPLTLIAFTSPTCVVCRELRPSLRAIAREYGDVALHEVELGPTTAAVFTAFGVRSTPYFVTVSADGTVAGGGVANSLEQVEVLVSEGRALA